MQNIHPSLYRRQIARFNEEIKRVSTEGGEGEEDYIQKRMEDFKARYAPWTGLFLDRPPEIFIPRKPAVLVLEEIGQDIELYPSDAPWQTNLFLSREEAEEFASQHYQGWEITQGSPHLPQETMFQVIGEERI